MVGALILVALLMSQSAFRTRRSLNQPVSGLVSLAEGVARTRVRRMGGNVGDPQQRHTRPAGRRPLRADDRRHPVLREPGRARGLHRRPCLPWRTTSASGLQATLVSAEPI